MAILVVVPAAIYFLLPDVSLQLTHSTHYVAEPNNLKELLWSGNFYLYFKLIIRVFLENVSTVAFIAAFLILAMWFLYIIKLDIFHKEKLSITILTLVLGMAFSFLSIFFADAATFVFDISYRNEPFYDFFVFCFARIGLIEEGVKLFPVILILAFTREIDEPYDIIYYAAASALGFAFIENLAYFSTLEDQVIQNRALLSVFGHIMFSSFAVYGYVLGKYKTGNHVAGYFVLTYLAAALAHGLFDFLTFIELLPFPYLLFFFYVLAWTIIVNNAINNSPFFSYQVVWQTEKQRYFLAIMLSAMIVLNYLIDVVQLGKHNATIEFIPSFFLGLGFAFFYVSSLMNFDLVKGYWRPIKLDYYNEPPPSDMYGSGEHSPLLLLKMNFLAAQNIVDYHVNLKASPYNDWLLQCLFQTEGKIIDRICIRQPEDEGYEVDPDWFLVELAGAINTTDYHPHLVLVKLKNKSESLLHEEYVECQLKLLRQNYSMNGNRIDYSQCKSCGDVRLSLATLPAFVHV
ncbi:PrsW family intramembrane metalloprotease [Rufibacter roseus]|uniref:PrsW family intramembrane metalloprotease n=1 Tax=Rufibacter roseus TaxID=1567108 RepID=A0ABW2DG33_9BACT|nr:PrsW family intramembrane metalloprotease [Rufibacter roseus]